MLLAFRFCCPRRCRNIRQCRLVIIVISFYFPIDLRLHIFKVSNDLICKIRKIACDFFRIRIIRVFVSLLPIRRCIGTAFPSVNASHNIGSRRIKPKITDCIRRCRGAYKNLRFPIDYVKHIIRNTGLFPFSINVNILFIRVWIMP